MMIEFDLRNPEGVQSASVDGRSVTGMDPLERIEAAEKLATKDALSGTNANGGAPSGWGGLRAARPIFPGGGPR